MELEELVTKEDVDQLLKTFAEIPKLGTTGIIAAIVLLVLLIVLFVFAKGLHKKYIHKKNVEQRTKDQASTKTVNQAMSDEWNEASAQLKKSRKEMNEKTGGKKKKKRPPRPKD